MPMFAAPRWDSAAALQLFSKVSKVSKFKVLCSHPMDKGDHAVHTRWSLQNLCGLCRSHFCDCNVSFHSPFIIPPLLAFFPS